MTEPVSSSSSLQPRAFVIPISTVVACLVIVVGGLWQFGRDTAADHRLLKEEIRKEVEIRLDAHLAQPYHTGMPPYVAAQLLRFEKRIDNLQLSVTRIENMLMEGRK